MRAPPPRRVRGEVTDPPPSGTPGWIRVAERPGGTAGTTLHVASRAYLRFMGARAGLLAAGTTYYLFLAVFSLIAFAYGIVAIVGADRAAEVLTEAISEAFPGMIGPEGLDPDRLRSIGQTTSVIGLLTLLYAGGGGMVAASASIRMVYGMPPDPRSFVKARLRLFGWLLVIGPLIVLSFVASTLLVGFASSMLDGVAAEQAAARGALRVAGLALTLGLDLAIVYLLLGVLGGIRPVTRARVGGAVAGALAIEVLKSVMALVIAFSAQKPQYGALAVPIGMLLVLYLQTTALYGAAALTGGISDRDLPLADLLPTPGTSADPPA